MGGTVTPDPAQPFKMVEGKPVSTRAPKFLVAGITVPGVYTFSLVVTDKFGNESAADTTQVTVRGG